jgi:enoyl-CoA hydratase/carnithine racemase
MVEGLDIRKDGRTTIFTINRPHVKNAVNVAVAQALQEEIKAFEESDQRVAVITSAGKHFCGGADLNDTPAPWKFLPGLGLRTSKPVICAVNGYAVGAGFVLTLMSDLVVASETAHFHYPEAHIGVSAGGIATLAARIPHKFAMEVMLMGEPVSAQRAYEMGFVNRVAPAGKHLEVAMEMARRLENTAPLVVSMLKGFVSETLPSSPYEKMARTARRMEVVSSSEDWANGLAAFLEQRAVDFNGR